MSKWWICVACLAIGCASSPKPMDAGDVQSMVRTTVAMVSEASMMAERTHGGDLSPVFDSVHSNYMIEQVEKEIKDTRETPPLAAQRITYETSLSVLSSLDTALHAFNSHPYPSNSLALQATCDALKAKMESTARGIDITSHTE